MLDIKKLDKSLRKTLANETTQTIDKWFDEYDKNLNNNIMANTATTQVESTIPAYYGVRRIRKNKRQLNDYFLGVREGKVIFTENPLKGDNYAHESVANTVADLLKTKDNVNTYEVFPITIG